ncbi:14456_t:CDS:2, partial [Gigaspora rosea]
MENKSQVPISELENTGLKENLVQEALTDSLSLNTSWADNTEVTYEKGDSLCQSNSTEKFFFSSNGRLEDLMVDQIEGSGTNLDNVMSDVASAAETTKKSEDSREINSEGKK